MYYFGLLVQVHLRADRDNLQGLTKEELPKVKDVLKERGHLLLPLILLVLLLMMGYTPTLVAVATIIATIVIAALRPSSRMGFRDVLQALEAGVRDTLGVAAACAAVGITVGVFSLTGLGLKLANIILMMGSGSLFMTLLFTMIASIILGLGLPSIPCYIITATMAAPYSFHLWGRSFGSAFVCLLLWCDCQFDAPDCPGSLCRSWYRRFGSTADRMDFV